MQNSVMPNLRETVVVTLAQVSGDTLTPITSVMTSSTTFHSPVLEVFSAQRP